MWIQISLTGQWQNSIYRLTTDLIWERTGFVMALSKMKFSFENVSLPALCDTSSTTQPLCGICERFSQKPRAHWWTTTPSPCRSVQLWLLCYFFHTVFALCPLVCLFLLPAEISSVIEEGREQGMMRVMMLWFFSPFALLGLICICAAAKTREWIFSFFQALS